MKLLKKDHYTVTRLLLEDSDGKILELLVDSLGSYYLDDWEGNPDGSIIPEGWSWEKYTRSTFEGDSVFGPNCDHLDEQPHED